VPTRSVRLKTARDARKNAETVLKPDEKLSPLPQTAANVEKSRANIQMIAPKF
jgi:hypothetical protein